MRYHVPVALVLLLLAGCNTDRVNAPRTSFTAPKAVVPIPDPVPDPCAFCVQGPTTFARGEGAPVTESLALSVGSGTYIIDIDDLGSRGADGVVRLGGQVLLPARAPDELGPRHFQFSEVLSGTETLEVRLTGKPGSQLRVAIWRTVWVEIDEYGTQFPLQLVLDGSGQLYWAQVTNYIADASNVEVRTWIKQGGAVRAAGSQAVQCWGFLPLGYLPVGPCQTQLTAVASNTAAGVGTLAYGSATAVIVAVQVSGSTAAVLDSVELPVELVAVPVVYSVTMSPRRALVAIGDATQITATVLASPGTSTSVGWYSSDPTVATAATSGAFTGVSAGNTQIVAVSEIDATKYDFGWLYVFNPLASLPFQFLMTEPLSNVTVHRDDAGAGTTTVTLVATAIGPTVIFSPFSSTPEFWVRAPGGPWILTGGTVNVSVADNGINRTITYTKNWNPNATTAPFADPSTTSLEVIAVGLRVGIPLATTTSKQLTLVVP